MDKKDTALKLPEISIQAVTEDDYAQWFRLWIKYQEFYRVDIPDNVTRLTWQRFLNPVEPVFCLVAKYQGEIVGLVHYLFHRSTWAETEYCYLEDLYVAQEIRGKHIGKRLIEHVQVKARKRHASRLYWHTHETNLRGQRLYDWLGKKSGMIEYLMPVQ